MKLIQDYDKFWLSPEQELDLGDSDFYAEIDAQLVSDYPVDLLALNATKEQRADLDFILNA